MGEACQVGPQHHQYCQQHISIIVASLPLDLLSLVVNTKTIITVAIYHHHDLSDHHHCAPQDRPTESGPCPCLLLLTLLLLITTMTFNNL